MQIIPIQKNTLEKSTYLGLDSTASQKPTFGFATVLAEKNAHLLPKKTHSTAPNKELGYEDILRLRNQLKEKNKLSVEEEEALSSLLENGGKYSIESIIEQMAQGTRGLSGITPEEYVLLQQFLHDIGFNAEEVASLTESMATGENANSTLLSIIGAVQNTVENTHLLHNVKPILQKIFTGSYGTKSPLEEIQQQVDADNFLRKTQELLKTIENSNGAMGETQKQIATSIREELVALMAEKEQKMLAEEHSSLHNSKASHADFLRYSSSATASGFSAFSSNSSTQISTRTTHYTPSVVDVLQENIFEGNGDFSQNFGTADDSQHILHSMQNIVSVQYSATSSFSSLISNSNASNTLPMFTNAELIENVGKAFISIQNGGVNQLTIQLNPYELGRVELQLQYEDGRMHALLRPENTDVYRMLKDSSSALVHSLEEQGLKVDSITIVENKGEWNQYQSSREDLSQNTEEKMQERAFQEEQERDQRIRSLIQQLTKTQEKTEQIQSTRLLDTVV